MGNPEPNILFDYANMYLNPSQICLNENWQTDYSGGQFDSDIGHLNILVMEKYVLEMLNITLPANGMQELSSKEAIISSVHGIIGDFGQNLERCVRLAEEGVIQDSLCFTAQGLLDYSNKDKSGYQKVTEWIRNARDYSSNPSEGFPEDMKLPEGLTIEFVPTFRKLRYMDGLGEKVGHNYTIKGETFAQQVENFLNMYDAVTAHIDWKEKTEREIRLAQIRKGHSICSGTLPIAKLVLPKSLEE